MAKQRLISRPVPQSDSYYDNPQGPAPTEYGTYDEGGAWTPYTGSAPVQQGDGYNFDSYYDDGQRDDPGYMWSKSHGVTPVLEALEASQRGTPLPSGIAQWLQTQAGGATPQDQWNNYVASAQDHEAHANDMFGINGMDAGTWQGPLMMASAIAGGAFAGAGAGAEEAIGGEMGGEMGLDPLSQGLYGVYDSPSFAGYGGVEGLGGAGSTGADALAGTDALGGVEGMGGANPGMGGLDQYADASQYAPTMNDATQYTADGPMESPPTPEGPQGEFQGVDQQYQNVQGLEDQQNMRTLEAGDTPPAAPESSWTDSLSNAGDWMQNHSVMTGLGVGAGLAGLQMLNSSKTADRNKQIASDAAARQASRQSINDAPPVFPSINIRPPTRVQDQMALPGPSGSGASGSPFDMGSPGSPGSISQPGGSDLGSPISQPGSGGGLSPQAYGAYGQQGLGTSLSADQLRRYGRGPERRFFNAKGGPPAHGTPGMTGGLNAMRMVDGHGGGQDDTVPAMLSPTEYVLDAETVSALGDGNPHEGAKKLDKFRERLRAHKRGASVKNIPPKARPIESYMGAR